MRSHNHIFQSVNGIDGCPACDRIDPYHMTEHFFAVAYFQTYGVSVTTMLAD